MTPSFTIGILGGMGPRATVYFEQKLLERFTCPDQLIPRIVVINDGSVPDRTEFLCSGGADPLPVLIQNALALLRLGPNIICVPCNTAHAELILGRLQKKIILPIVDMPLATLGRVSSLGITSTLILGTEGTKAGRVYDARAVNVRIMYPAPATQREINRLIHETKIAGFTEKNRDTLELIIRQSEAESVVLACTELSLLNRKITNSSIMIDALESLVDACVDAHQAYAINMITKELLHNEA
jgi:aspartate racemase